MNLTLTSTAYSQSCEYSFCSNGEVHKREQSFIGSDTENKIIISKTHISEMKREVESYEEKYEILINSRFIQNYDGKIKIIKDNSNVGKIIFGTIIVTESELSSLQHFALQLLSKYYLIKNDKNQSNKLKSNPFNSAGKTRTLKLGISNVFIYDDPNVEKNRQEMKKLRCLAIESCLFCKEGDYEIETLYSIDCEVNKW